MDISRETKQTAFCQRIC